MNVLCYNPFTGEDFFYPLDDLPRLLRRTFIQFLRYYAAKKWQEMMGE